MGDGSDTVRKVGVPFVSESKKTVRCRAAFSRDATSFNPNNERLQQVLNEARNES